MENEQTKQITLYQLEELNRRAWRWVHGNKKPFLRDKEFSYVKAVAVDGKSQSDAAKEMGVSRQTISAAMLKFKFALNHDWNSNASFSRGPSGPSAGSDS